MLVEPWFHISAVISLAIVGGLLFTSVVASLLAARLTKTTNA
jgi:hypothetical protein